MSNAKEIGLKGSATSVIENFRNLSPSERIHQISKTTHLSDYELSNLSEPNQLPLNAANAMIENVIGKIEIPLGIATNFKVNLKDYLIPMAIEEPSVVAAASNMAKIIRSSLKMYQPNLIKPTNLEMTWKLYKKSLVKLKMI